MSRKCLHLISLQLFQHSDVHQFSLKTYENKVSNFNARFIIFIFIAIKIHMRLYWRSICIFYLNWMTRVFFLSAFFFNNLFIFFFLCNSSICFFTGASDKILQFTRCLLFFHFLGLALWNGRNCPGVAESEILS